MRTLSLGNVAGLILIGIYLLFAAGRQDIVWKGISFMRQKAFEGLVVDWGCPIKTKGNCKEYVAEQYEN
tara:strand:- start:209 stop:415 length:207 start_codon:yes stop_codon:yes gene_type:complete